VIDTVETTGASYLASYETAVFLAPRGASVLCDYQHLHITQIGCMRFPLYRHTTLGLPAVVLR
jgi:hypothetical protein